MFLRIKQIYIVSRRQEVLLTYINILTLHVSLIRSYIFIYYYTKYSQTMNILVKCIWAIFKFKIVLCAPSFWQIND